VRWQLECCSTEHSMCTPCLRRTCDIRWECPFHGVRIPMLVVCGISNSASTYVAAVQQDRVRMERRPACPAVGGCHGLLQPETERYCECDVCLAQFCARPTCREPYTVGHKCASEAVLASRLEPAVRPCPGCGIMCDKTVGCQILYHAACGTHWCYQCGVPTDRHGCTHARCRAVAPA
jgi:hypothetical protein